MKRDQKIKIIILNCIKGFIVTAVVGILVFSVLIHNARTEKSAEKTAHKFLVSLYDASPDTLGYMLPSLDEYSDSKDNLKIYIKKLNQSIKNRFGNCYTKNFWNYMIGNRMWLTAPEAAQNRHCNINVKSVKFDKINSAENEIHFNFVVEMEMQIDQDQNLDVIQLSEILAEPIIQKGEVWLVFEGFSYKINQLTYSDNQLVQYTY